MTLKILYLHDINSSGLTEDQQHILKGFNFEIAAPIIDYTKVDYTFFYNLYKNEKPNLIIGCGMGGRVAYWLSNTFSTKALLFNPAIGVKIYDEILQIPNYFKPTRYSDQIFLFGRKSELVKRKEVLKYTGNAFHERTYDDMAETIDNQHFKRGILEAVNYLL